MADNGALWQVQSTANSGNESGATPPAEVVLFNVTPITSGQYVFQTEVNVRVAVPENEAVDDTNNEVQDMGLDGIDIQITGTIRNADNDVAGNSLNKLVKWLKEAKGGASIVGYEVARFGLRLDDMPQFNVTPDGNGVAGNNTFGYTLANVRFIHDGEGVDRIGIIIQLRLAGALASAI